MRVIFCGSREWSDEKAIADVVDAIVQAHGPFTLVHGAARGADSIAAGVASKAGLVVEGYPADWNLHGRRAGPLRNMRMLGTGVDLVVAFKDGFDDTLQRGGTEHMVKIARDAGIRTMVISHDIFSRPVVVADE